MTDREIAHWLWIATIFALVLARWGWLSLMEFINERKKYANPKSLNQTSTLDSPAGHNQQGMARVGQRQRGYSGHITLARLMRKTQSGAQ